MIAQAYGVALAVLPLGCMIGLAAAVATRETFCRPRATAQFHQ